MILGAREPAELARRAEEHPQLPPGTCERVSGYGVMSLPFRSSAGEPFTSIWHRDAAGRRTFYGSARSEVACTRYSGAGVGRVRLGPAEPLAEQAHVTDFSMPQRGVSAVGRVFLTPITEGSR